MSAVDDRGLEFVEWAEYTCDELSDYGYVPRPVEGEDWKVWARAVCQVPQVANLLPPNPDQFADWHKWADRFNQVIDVR